MPNICGLDVVPGMATNDDEYVGAIDAIVGCAAAYVTVGCAAYVICASIGAPYMYSVGAAYVTPCVAYVAAAGAPWTVCAGAASADAMYCVGYATDAGDET
mmetsp:Transcript_10933/g.30978  ORF Transcript_10933/g.30978 Transcript_10933/m.30978 type:complete len:101 (-) Transcript_10933:232-534(-)